MRFYAAVLFVFAMILAAFTVTAEAQTRSGRGLANEKTQVVENACRVRINDLRTNIGELRSQLSQIRACSEQRKMAIRQGANIVCRDISLPHHRWTNLTEIDFGKSNTANDYGLRHNIKGAQGDPGRDVQCVPCGAWQDPVCPPSHNGNYTDFQTCPTGDCCGSAQPITLSCSCNLGGTWENPSCPAGFTGTHTAAQVCSVFGQCCGSPQQVSVCCDNGNICTACDDWTPVNTWCPALNRNVVSSHTCPSGNCCDPQPGTETCPGACTPGFYTYEYTNWTICENGQQTRECERCDGQNADCGECGGECSRTCTPTCTTYSWIPSSGWSSCSGGGTETCGTGTQTRPGSCRCDQSGETVSDSLCNLADRQRNCNGWTYNYGEWGACSGGSKSRECKRCDNTTVACSNCGGNCSTTDGCGSSGNCCDIPPACSSSGNCFCEAHSGMWVNPVTGIHYECEYSGGCSAGQAVMCPSGGVCSATMPWGSPGSYPQGTEGQTWFHSCVAATDMFIKSLCKVAGDTLISECTATCSSGSWTSNCGQYHQ